MSRNLILLFLSLPLVLLGTSCGKNVDANNRKPAGRPPTQVVAMKAKRQPVAENLVLIGSVLANEMVEIKAEIDGKVEVINFKEGEAVSKGKLLIQLDESKLTNEVAEAEANFELTKTTYERNKELAAEKLISPQEFEESMSLYQAREALLNLRRRQLKDSRIFAPFDGVMGSRSVSPGQVIQKNTILTWLVDLDPVKIEINVPERFISQLKVGQSIEIVVSAYSDRKFRGEVFFVSPFVDPAMRTALVKARIPNPELQLIPGMFANLELTITIRENAVVIPEVALSRILEDDRASIFVVDDKQTAQMRMVSLGARMPGLVEITKGLQAGELVIVEGVQKIGPGAAVKLAPEAAAAPYQNDSRPASTNQASSPP